MILRIQPLLFSTVFLIYFFYMIYIICWTAKWQVALSAFKLFDIRKAVKELHKRYKVVVNYQEPENKLLIQSRNTP